MVGRGGRRIGCLWRWSGCVFGYLGLEEGGVVSWILTGRNMEKTPGTY